MELKKPGRYIVFGAGAIGNTIGGLLSRTGASVLFVARPAIAAAIKAGVAIIQDGKRGTFQAEAVTSAREIHPDQADVLLITTKSQATGEAADELAGTYNRSVPVVCLQNGVRNEEIAARRFQNVYAGLVFFSAVQIDPQVITLPPGRVVAIGAYPDGLDELSESVCADLRHAGFEALASEYVMAMKWGKLIANLNNATHAITGYWLELGMVDPDMRELMFRVREEGLRVLDAAGIAVEPPPGKPSPIRIRKMTEELKRPVEAKVRTMGEEQRTYASMWQDLELGRKSSEADFLNGEIVELGKLTGVPTPYNSTLLAEINRMFEKGSKPGTRTPAELHAHIKRQSQN